MRVGWAHQDPKSATPATKAVAATPTAITPIFAGNVSDAVMVRVKNLDLTQTVSLRWKHSWDGSSGFIDLDEANARFIDDLAPLATVESSVDLDTLKYIQLYCAASGAGCNVELTYHSVAYKPRS